MSADFQNAPLDNMVAVGAVEAYTARLWARSQEPGLLSVTWWPEGQEQHASETTVHVAEGNHHDNTCAFRIPADGERLVPRTRYRFRVRHSHGGCTLGEGSFETAPAHAGETPTRFSVGLVSCHQPFDESGAVQPSAREMLRAALRCFHEHEVKFALMLGDQMYADHPPALSLFDPAHFTAVGPPDRSSILECSAAEVRRLYHNRYRHFWNLPELQTIQAEFPCYMMLDDHDVVNNWGSNPAHDAPPWCTVGEGALRAYADYQASRVKPSHDVFAEDFHYAFSYGHTAVFVMDIRTARKPGKNGRLYTEVQAAHFQSFLHEHRDKAVLLIALSVPVVHVPGHLARLGAKLPAWGEDFSDRWSAEAHLRDRDRLLKMLFTHQQANPGQRIILLSGDIHMGCAHRIRWQKGVPALYQFISSPITHRPAAWVQLVSKLLISLKRRIATHDDTLSGKVEWLPGDEGFKRNPYDGLNVGIVEIETPKPENTPAVRLCLYGHRGDEPVCVYRSAPL